MRIGTLDIQYGDVKIKQFSKVTYYLGCELDESLSREAMALIAINKINDRLNLLYRKNRYLTSQPSQLPTAKGNSLRYCH